jgi:hypothetical protein
MHFPAVRLDTSGSLVTVGVGLLVDRSLSASQTDSYKGIPNWPGAPTATGSFETAFGGGALIDVGMSLPLGSSRMLFDLAYVMRSTSQAAATYSWLSNSGLRISASVCF